MIYIRLSVANKNIMPVTPTQQAARPGARAILARPHAPSSDQDHRRGAQCIVSRCEYPKPGKGEGKTELMC